MQKGRRRAARTSARVVRAFISVIHVVKKGLSLFKPCQAERVSRMDTLCKVWGGEI
jgi:hypothetical protein